MPILLKSLLNNHIYVVKRVYCNTLTKYKMLKSKEKYNNVIFIIIINV